MGCDNVRDMALGPMIFTISKAVRSTCVNSRDDDEEEENEDRFHLALLQTIL